MNIFIGDYSKHILIAIWWCFFFFFSLFFFEAKAGKPFIGISFQGIDKKTALALNLDNPKGVLIRDIALGSSADLAGLNRGDLIISYAGKLIEDVAKLSEVASKTKPGQTIEMVILRKGVTKTFGIELSQQHEAWNIDGPDILRVKEVGLTLAGLTKKIRERFEVRWGALGVIITLVDVKIRKTMELRRGDIIVQVNQTPIWTTGQFNDAYREAQKEDKDSILLLVERKGSFRFFLLSVLD